VWARRELARMRVRARIPTDGHAAEPRGLCSYADPLAASLTRARPALPPFPLSLPRSIVSRSDIFAPLMQERYRAYQDKEVVSGTPLALARAWGRELDVKPRWQGTARGSPVVSFGLEARPSGRWRRGGPRGARGARRGSPVLLTLTLILASCRVRLPW
jgi:hypothetical protein